MYCNCVGCCVLIVALLLCVAIAGVAVLLQVCYTTTMTTKLDALAHLPIVNAGPWKYSYGRYERYVVFTCFEYRKRRSAMLSVRANGDGTALITVDLDGIIRSMSVSELADPFNTANETLVALAGTCGCCGNRNGESL